MKLVKMCFERTLNTMQVRSITLFEAHVKLTILPLMLGLKVDQKTCYLCITWCQHESADFARLY